MRYYPRAINTSNPFAFFYALSLSIRPSFNQPSISPSIHRIINPSTCHSICSFIHPFFYLPKISSIYTLIFLQCHQPSTLKTFYPHIPRIPPSVRYIRFHPSVLSQTDLSMCVCGYVCVWTQGLTENVLVGRKAVYGRLNGDLRVRHESRSLSKIDQWHSRVESIWTLNNIYIYTVYSCRFIE